ncbi:sulfotransferase family protein [Francisella sp. SYW-2]|uniref:sulfotransferase family protein n=1 Tax=Francisella sp. SYW-2 TaxID=2610886 RepID=UPI00123DE2A0|nr:DUF3552 domain-containing protein [Francisella sp. SYW-2]
MSNKQTCILVLGMHRSGTSALTGLLSMLDVYLGNTTVGDDDNEKGYFENSRIQQFNDKMLGSIDSSWDDEFFSVDKLKNLQCYVDDLINLIREEFGTSTIFAIKDPRMCLLFPLWEKALNTLDVDIKIIIPYRNPLEVARSLSKRNSMSINKAMLLWAYHFLFAEKFSRLYDRVFVSFDDLLSNTLFVVEYMTLKLNINFRSKYNDNENLISEFLEQGLKHHNSPMINPKDIAPKIVKSILEMKNNFNQGCIVNECEALMDELFDYKKIFYNDNLLMVLKEGEAAKYKVRLWSEEYHQISDSRSYIQGYINSGNGYDEVDSICFDVLQNGQSQEIIFDLSKYDTVNKIRIDPLTTSCIVKINSIFCDDIEASVCYSNASYVCDSVYYFDDSDPQIYLDVSCFEGLKKLVLNFQFINIADSALTIIDDFKSKESEKDQELAQKDQELAQKDQELAQKDQELAQKDQELAQKDQELAQKDQKLAQRNQDLSEKDFKLNKVSYELKQTLSKLEARNRYVSQLESELTEVYTSTSWKVSKPVRIVKKILRRIKKVFLK